MSGSSIPTRVLHIGESILGGCGTYLNEVVPLQMKALGPDNVRCLVPYQHAGQLRDVPSEAVWTFERSSRPAGLPRLAVGAMRAVRQWRPDLVHAHSTFAGATVRGLGLMLPMPPVVYCPHGWVFDVATPGWARSATRTAERWLSHRCAAIVAISDAERVQGLAAGIVQSKLKLVRNGVAATLPPQRAAWQDGRIKLLFVGRLDRQKGADVLLEATRNLGDKFCVRIVGKAVVGADGKAAHAVPPHVQMLGWLDLPDVAAQINAADVIVMPSRWEGFGLVAVEAMRAGKPVVASAVGGLVEIVVDGVTGCLVPAGDAASFERVLRGLDRARLFAMGEAGRDRFQRLFTSERTVVELLNLYQDVLSRLPVPTPHRPADSAGQAP